MADVYRIWGAELSPYSVKVRSYFRYKQIPHSWQRRDAETQKYGRLPLIPVVATPDDEGLQDSTPIIEAVEARHPEPSIHPSDPVAAFVSTLLEEFGDEWGNKWMFHFRWAREVDQTASAGRIAGGALASGNEQQHAAMVAQVKSRMVDRVWFVGSNEKTAPQIEASFKDALRLLNVHLADRPYLFGGRPAFGDFGLWGQIYNAWTDPTPCALIEALAPNVLDWVQRMLWPRIEGEFEDWTALEPTLLPLLEQQVGRLFLPWTLANAAALASGSEEFSVELASGTWTQKPQKYHAKSLAVLREKYAAAGGKGALDPVLKRAGCLEALRAQEAGR